MIKALPSCISHCRLILARVVQLSHLGFVIMISGKQKEATEFAVLRNWARIKHKR